jgi:hypothetical protein
VAQSTRVLQKCAELRCRVRHSLVQYQALANAFLSNELTDKVVAVSVQTCKLFRLPEKGLLDTQGG